MEQPAILYGTYLPTATAAATDSYAGTAAANVLQGTEDTYWRPANTSGDKTLTLDLGLAVACDRLCLLGEPLDGVQIDLLASADNFATAGVEILTDQTLQAAVNAATLAFTSATYRYWRLVFKNGFIPSPLRIAHVLLGAQAVFPWFEADFDPDSFQVTGEAMVSNGGIYLGTNVERSMREFSLAWGQVTDLEFAAVVNPWAQACVGRSAFFLIPDKSGDDCYFGWCKGDFSAPRKLGLHAVSPVTFTTRAA